MRFPDDVPTLTDDVVTLRAHTAEDARGSWEQCQDPVSQRWTTVPVPYSMSDARDFVEGIVPRGWREDRDYAFAVHARDDEGVERYAGTISLRPEGSRRAEIAYGSHPWCRGRGVMERALRLLLEWGFSELDLAMVVWWANKGNWASRKLAWRLGFQMEGTVRSWLPQRGELRDGWVGSLLRDDPREPGWPWYDVPTILGPTVTLRAFRDADAPRIQEACSEDRVQHWLRSVPSPYTLDDAQQFLEDRREKHATGAGLSWAVADPATDVLLANVSLFDVRPGRDAEVGFWTHPAARGRGVMTEACGLVVRHAFVPEDDGGLGLRRLRATAADGNAASVHVIRANGFTPVGREREASRLGDGTPVDLLVHDLLEPEWSGLAARP
ncbi:MAG TPA: GNAT family N-acetyltransferase [Nocardioides sp.]|nr:GNAT family N-acetyltransferase [Nocardioides sp.]